jgi:hypothetical protein
MTDCLCDGPAASSAETSKDVVSKSCASNYRRELVTNKSLNKKGGLTLKLTTASRNSRCTSLEAYAETLPPVYAEKLIKFVEAERRRTAEFKNGNDAHTVTKRHVTFEANKIIRTIKKLIRPPNAACSSGPTANIRPSSSVMAVAVSDDSSTSGAVPAVTAEASVGGDKVLGIILS